MQVKGVSNIVTKVFLEGHTVKLLHSEIEISTPSALNSKSQLNRFQTHDFQC